MKFQKNWMALVSLTISGVIFFNHSPERIGDTKKEVVIERKISRVSPIESFKERIKDNPDSRSLYEESLKRLDNSPESELIALYITSNLYGDDDIEFLLAFEEIKISLNANADKVHALLIKHNEKLKESAFIYQMASELGSSLSIDPAKSEKKS